MNKELTFRKRKALVKKETFEAVQNSELNKTANKNTEYASIKVIMSVLNPIMDKYDVDLEISIGSDAVLITWYDCLSDKLDNVTIDIQKIKDVGRLASMPNEVQSYGAVLSYIRRYALTIALNLNSTDKIENSGSNYTKPTLTPVQPSQPKKTAPTINKEQLKVLHAKRNEAGISEEDLKTVINAVFKKSSTTALTTPEMNVLLKRFEKKINKEAS